MITEEDWAEIRDLYGDTVLHASESDKDFFEKLKDLVYMLRKICINNDDLDELNRKVEMLDSKEHVYFMAEQLATDASGVSVSRSKTLEDIENINKDTRQLSHDFLALKRNLIQMKSDCVLVK